MEVLVATTQNAQHVGDHRAPRRGDQPDAPRQHRQRLPSRRVEQALGRQLCFKLVEGQLQRAVAGRLQVFDDKLVFAPRVVHADAPARGHGQSVLWFEFHQTQRGLEQHGPQLRSLVLQSEVEVAGGGGLAVRDLALHPHLTEFAFQQLPDPRRQVRDRVDGSLRQSLPVKGKLLSHLLN